MILVRYTSRVLEARFLLDSHVGEHVFIPYISLIPSPTELRFHFTWQ
jgi:hypothetical protein